jgi:RNA polymerase sigma-70 factor (ECF subfamily)
VGKGGRQGAGWSDGPPGDGALLAAVAERDHDALAEIYRRHGGAVWAMANRLCRDQAPAGDVCEAVFAELWERPELFEPSRGTLRARLIAVAHARAVAVVRAADGPGAAGAPATGSGVTSVAGSSSSALDTYAESLDANARRALDKLDTAERDALLVCYIGGRPCREAASVLGVAEATVKASVRTGLVNLRRALDAEGVSR